MAPMDPRLSILYARRSIRRYQDKALPDELIDELLRAAMAAPSANNKQPWEFVVLTDPWLRRQMSRHHPHAAFASEAGAVFVLFGDPARRLLDHDLSAATENLLIAAAGLGLGACWCGMPEERQEPVRELCGIPPGRHIVSVVAVGYPAEDKPPRTQYDPAKVHWQRYGGQR